MRDEGKRRGKLPGTQIPKVIETNLGDCQLELIAILDRLVKPLIRIFSFDIRSKIKSKA
jgi:hypothetical protein